MMRVEFHTDPARLLEVAGEHLARDPVTGTVVATVTARAAADDLAGVERPPGAPRWWAVARDETGVAGVAMRTATGAPYPLYVLPMSDEAARAIGRAVVDRGEPATAVNGSLPAAELVATELARAAGGRVEMAKPTRLFELGELVEPSPRPAGALRPAEEADAELCLEWFRAFHADADEQAGRPRGSSPEISTHTLEEMSRRIATGTIWLWEDANGAPVHLTAGGPPQFGVARIGPVYTPPEHRGRGYAGAAVGEVSRLLRAAGSRVCLFTDQANPTSNALYERLGYARVADLGELVVVVDGPVSP